MYTKSSGTDIRILPESLKFAGLYGTQSCDKSTVWYDMTKTTSELHVSPLSTFYPCFIPV